jgi:hypothetical protein
VTIAQLRALLDEQAELGLVIRRLRLSPDAIAIMQRDLIALTPPDTPWQTWTDTVTDPTYAGTILGVDVYADDALSLGQRRIETTPIADPGVLRRTMNDVARRVLDDSETCALGDPPDGWPLATLVMNYLKAAEKLPPVVWSSDHVLAWHDKAGGGHSVRCSEEAIRNVVEERDALKRELQMYLDRDTVPLGGAPVVVGAGPPADGHGERLERAADIARGDCYQVVGDVVVISKRELAALGRRAGYRSDQKYANVDEDSREAGDRRTVVGVGRPADVATVTLGAVLDAPAVRAALTDVASDWRRES